MQSSYEGSAEKRKMTDTQNPPPAAGQCSYLKGDGNRCKAHYLAGILLKANDKDELEQRLERLESVLAGQQARPGAEEFEFVNPQSER